MAYIEKTAEGYRVGWRIGGRGAPKQYRAAPDKRSATDLKRRIENDIAQFGRVTIEEAEETPPSLQARLDDWLDAVALDLGVRTVNSYADAAALYLRWLALEKARPKDDLGLNLLTRDSLIKWQVSLVESGRSLTTVAKRAQAIRLAWEWLYDGDGGKKWLEAAPRKISTRKARPGTVIAPTWAEADKCVGACLDHDPRAPWLWVFAVIARFTGLRRSEILLLQWPDFDLERMELQLRGETTKGEASGRKLPLSKHLVEALATRGRHGLWVVPAPEAERVAADGDGRGHVDRNMTRAWKRAGVRPEAWKGQPCHAFRKTLQTEFELLGVRREVAEYLIGHQPAGTGPRHYIEAERALWPELVPAVAKIPPLPPAQALLPFRGR